MVKRLEEARGGDANKEETSARPSRSRRSKGASGDESDHVSSESDEREKEVKASSVKSSSPRKGLASSPKSPKSAKSPKRIATTSPKSKMSEEIGIEEDEIVDAAPIASPKSKRKGTASPKVKKAVVIQENDEIVEAAPMASPKKTNGEKIASPKNAVFEKITSPKKSSVEKIASPKKEKIASPIKATEMKDIASPKSPKRIVKEMEAKVVKSVIPKPVQEMQVDYVSLSYFNKKDDEVSEVLPPKDDDTKFRLDYSEDEDIVEKKPEVVEKKTDVVMEEAAKEVDVCEKKVGVVMEEVAKEDVEALRKSVKESIISKETKRKTRDSEEESTFSKDTKRKTRDSEEVKETKVKKLKVEIEEEKGTMGF